MTKETDILFGVLEIEIKNYHNRFDVLAERLPWIEKKILEAAIADIERAHELAIYRAAKKFVHSFEEKDMTAGEWLAENSEAGIHDDEKTGCEGEGNQPSVASDG